jgi:DNA-directed RNA polymerase specialized sigma24 family protein
MGNGLRVVIIPFDYEELPHDQQMSIVPICIASVDRHGNEIARVWFEQGVAPVQDQLRGIARYKLGDVRRVSELVEVTVHRLWEQHGSDAGFLPWRRVLTRAVWEAREMAVGGSKWRMKHVVPLALESLDEDCFGTSMTDPNRHEEIYERDLLIALIERRIERDHRAEIREVFKMLRLGYTWDEIATQLNNANPETLKKRFWRWMRRNFR